MHGQSMSACERGQADVLQEEQIDIVDPELLERLVKRRLKLVLVEVDAEYLAQTQNTLVRSRAGC